VGAALVGEPGDVWPLFVTFIGGNKPFAQLQWLVAGKIGVDGLWVVAP